MDPSVEYILLPGGLGYIGSITAVTLHAYLQEEGARRNKTYKIAIIDNLANSRPAVVDRINQSIGQEDCVAFHEVSLLDAEAVRGVFKSYAEKNTPIRYVIHFAALKAVGESVQKPLLYYENNIVGTLNLLKAMQDFKCANLIFSSSATVYKPGANVDEEAPMQPSNPYGETKIAVEYLIRSWQRANGGRVVSLRYFNPVGALKNGLLGDSPTVFPNNLFPYIEQVAVGNRSHLNIFGKDWDTPDGTGVRDYIHVVDLAEGHVAALKQLVDRNEKAEDWYDYFNLGTGNGISVLQIVHAYSKALGRELPHQFAPRREGDVATLTANPSKAAQLLGWKTRLTLDEMCQDSINFIQKNPNGIQ